MVVRWSGFTSGLASLPKEETLRACEALLLMLGLIVLVLLLHRRFCLQDSRDKVPNKEQSPMTPRPKRKTRSKSTVSPMEEKISCHSNPEHNWLRPVTGDLHGICLATKCPVLGLQPFSSLQSSTDFDLPGGHFFRHPTVQCLEKEPHMTQKRLSQVRASKYPKACQS